MDNTPRYGDPDNTLLRKIAGLLYAGGGVAPGAGVASFNGRSGIVSLTSGDVTGALGFTPANGALYVLKSGDSMSGNLDVGGVFYTTIASGRVDFDANIFLNGTAPTLFGVASRNIRIGQDPASGGGYLRFYGGTATRVRRNFSSAPAILTGRSRTASAVLSSMRPR